MSNDITPMLYNPDTGYITPLPVASKEITVNKEALREVLKALNCPNGCIEKLQSTRSLITPNAIDILYNQYAAITGEYL